MSNQADAIIPEDQYNQVLPYMRVVGGKKPNVTMSNQTIGHAIDVAEKRAQDTGLDVRILDIKGKLVAQVEAM